jgi:restriction system protein
MKDANYFLKQVEKIVIQLKRQKNKVGVSAIQQVYTAKKLNRAQEALVITTSDFTEPAKKMAKQLGVELWNRQRLLKELNASTYIYF